jgi:uncharacterized protein
MTRYRNIFPGGHQLFVVIHVMDKEQVLRNTRIAVEEGADGIFLIDHHEFHATPKLLKESFEVARGAYSDLRIGLNFLGMRVDQAYHYAPEETFAIWSDNSRAELSPEGIDRIKQTWRKYHYGDSLHPLYFGGVAFKYQNEEEDPAQAAKTASRFLDVITTSGTRTGTPPTVEKIRLMRDAIGDHPLAIASGITPDNVSLFLPYINCVLVATGISKSDTELDAKLVSRLRKNM